MSTWINPRTSADPALTAVAVMQERIDRSPALQELFRKQREFRAAHPGGVWTLITNDDLRAQWHVITAPMKDALAAAGVTIPEGYTFDFSGSGQLVKDEGGFNWLLAVGVLAAPLAVAFLPGIIAGAGTSAAAAPSAAVLPSSSIPLAYSAAVPTIASQGASAAVYAGTASAVGSAATAGAVAATGATGGAATAVKVATAVAPKIAGLLAPKPEAYWPDYAPGEPFPTYAPVTSAGLLGDLQNPMVLAALAGIVIVVLVLARK